MDERGRSVEFSACNKTNITAAEFPWMHVRTFVTQFHEHPCFVFHDRHIANAEGTIAFLFVVRPRKGSKHTDSGDEAQI